MQSGACRECGRVLNLRDDGRVPLHPAVSPDTNPAQTSFVRCQGSGKAPKRFATDSSRKAPARLHRALDRVMDTRPVRAKDLNTTPPRDALASQAKARAWLESLQERMQPAYAAEDKARERYKNASSDQRDRYDLEKKWDIASAKVAQLEKEWDQAHAAVKRAIPGFEW